MEESQNEAGQNRRPTPVRKAMEGSEPEGADEGGEVRGFQDPATGQEWVARVSGRSRSGVIPLRIIPLIEVDFFKADQPGQPVRRGLRQGESLDDLDENGLLRLLKESSPYTPPVSDSPAPDGRAGRNRPRRKG